MAKLDINEMYPDGSIFKLPEQISYEIIKLAAFRSKSWLEVLELILTIGDPDGVPAVSKVTAHDLARLNSLVLIEQFPREDH